MILRSVVSRAILLALCLALPAGSASADMLMLTLPAILAKKQTPSRHSWQPPQLIEDANDYQLTMAMDAAGNAIAVRTQYDDTGRSIWANRYTPSGGWETAEAIENNTGGADAPQIAFDGAGNALVVWMQGDGCGDSGCYSIWANRYTPSGGWGTAETIETGMGSAQFPYIAVDEAGNAFAVWGQSDGMTWRSWVNRYIAGSGWGTAEIIDNSAGGATCAHVAVDGAGNALAVWAQGDDSIGAKHYIAGSGWGTAEIIETDADWVLCPDVAFDGAGNALAVWMQYDGAVYSIWANRYVAGSGWGTIEAIESGAGEAWFSELAFDGAGNALAVWAQDDGTGIYSIMANRYVSGSGWGMAEAIESYAAEADVPRIAFDGAGNALAIWRQYDGTAYSIWANRYTPSGGWGTAETIVETDADRVGYLQLAVDGAGNALAVWRQYDGSSWNIMAAWYK